MTDEDFNRLATRYLEDAIDENGRQLLNRELLDSPERVRQFNDLRVLAGMIMEHGRSEKDQAKVVDFPSPESKRERSRPWLSAAALLMIGLLVGLLLGRPWKSGRGTDSDPGKVAVAAVNLIDGGFEKADPFAVTGYPEEAGQWTGDAVEVVPDEDTGIKPFEGKAMLCLTLKANTEPAPAPKATPQRAVQWQIVDLGEAERTKEPMVAELCARFNRDKEVPDPETPCRVELYALRGSPETAQAQLESESYLASASTHLQTDADPLTWELAETSLRVPPEAEFLLLGISGIGESHPQPFGGEAFSGHYADGVELNLRSSNSSLTNNDKP